MVTVLRPAKQPRLPPVPLVPLPTASTTAPPQPPVDAPEPKKREPLLPAFADPELNTRNPLEPAAPPFALDTKIAPLLVAEPSPECIHRAPPVSTVLRPATNESIAPSPLVPLPGLMLT